MVLFKLAAAWTVGITLAAAAGAGIQFSMIIGGVAFATGSFVAGRRDAVLSVLLLTAVAAFGANRYGAAAPNMQDSGLSRYNDSGEDVTIRGLVVDVEEGERSQQIRVSTSLLQLRDGYWAPTSGDLLVTTRPFPRIDYGDTIVVSGRIETPQPLEDFDYRAFLERQGIGSVSLFPAIERLESDGGGAVQQRLISVRGELSDGIERSMPEPEAALARGILLGERGGIPDELTESFNASGLSHLIAISGYNMMLVSGLCVGVFWPVMGRRKALVASLIVVFCYAVFVGGSPPVMRAAVMATFVLGAQVVGRPGRSFHALMLAVALLLVIDLRWIDDVSFQLSVLATAGIVLGASKLEDVIAALPGGVFRSGIGRYLAGQLAVTASASVAVLPVMALSFGRVSLVSLPANLLAGPAFSLAILASLASSIAGVIDTDLGRTIGEAACLPLAYIIEIARLLGSLPDASAEVGVLWACVLCVIAALALYALGRNAPLEEERPRRLRVHWALQISAVLLLATVAMSLQGDGSHPEGIEVTMLDVGQGDAFLIETAEGRVILVDGGPSGSRLLNQLGEALPITEHLIDLVVISHPQEDHIGGLVELLDRYDVGAILTGPNNGTSATYDALQEKAAIHGVPMITAEAGTMADLGDRARLEVIGPARTVAGADAVNENSLVLRLIYEEFSLLLTGDIGFEAEAALLDSGFDLTADVLKVAHHGSDGSTSAAFLDAVSPALALISAGAENTYGHPSPSTRLRLAGMPTLRTDLNGRITVTTDGFGFEVKAERGTAGTVELGQSRK